MSTFQQYISIDALNWTTLRERNRSARHFKYRREHQREDTPRLGLGRALHTAVLEPERFATDYACYSGDRRGNKWKAFKLENAGRTIITEPERELVVAMRDSILSTLHARMHLELGRAEQTIEWTDAETGLRCKARLDWISDAMPSFLDLKTTSTVDAILFGNTAARMLYHGQMAFYYEGLIATQQKREPYLLAVEAKPPFDVGLFAVQDDVLDEGRGLVRDLIRRVAEDEHNQSWPGRYAEAQVLSLPSWAYVDPDEFDPGDLGISMNETEGADAL